MLPMLCGRATGRGKYLFSSPQLSRGQTEPLLDSYSLVCEHFQTLVRLSQLKIGGKHNEFDFNKDGINLQVNVNEDSINL